ncbi:MAG: GGDEF domain-containing protein [Proteocatella sp.]
MDILLETQVSIFMCILLCLLTVHAYFKLDIENKTDRIFIYLQISILAIIILELISIVINKTSWIKNIPLHKFVNAAGFAMASIPQILMMAFISCWANAYKKTKKSIIAATAIPFLILLAMSILSCKYNLIFNVDSQNLYSRGPFFWISPFESGYYYILILVTIWLNRKFLSRDEKTIFISVTLVTMILGAVQLKYHILLTIWNSWAMATTMIYIFILYEKSKRDTLTGLGNRMEYTCYIKSMERKRDEKFAVISIDMDRLKHINDKFGHQEGDRAIRIFAGLLRETFSNYGRCIRMGGDEFIVFIRDDDEKHIEERLDMLKMRMQQYNHNSNNHYCISFSYGIEICNLQESITEIIKKSDISMYQQKNEKYN